MVGQILFVFGIQEFIHHRAVPNESEHSSTNIRGPSDKPRIQNGNFLKNSLNNFYSITVIYDDHTLK
jgi:ABC-type uncharacterized transport system substrate-binding protein